MIRRPITQTRRVVLGISSVVVLLVAYSFLSYRQHVRNPKDTTIPTFRQMADKDSGVPQIFKADRRAHGHDFWGPWDKESMTDHLEESPIVFSDASVFESLRAKLSRITGIAIWHTFLVLPETPLSWLEHGRERAEKITSSWVFRDSEATLLRFFGGFIIGIVISFLLSITIGTITSLEAFIRPTMVFISQIPPTATMGLFFVVFGMEYKMFVAIIAVGVIPSLTASIYLAVKDVPDELIYTGYTRGSSSMEVVTAIIIPYILPRVIENIKLHISPAIVFLIAVEYMNSDAGFGYRLKIQSRRLNMSVVFPYLALLGGYGYCLNWGLTKLQKKICHWAFPNGGH